MKWTPKDPTRALPPHYAVAKGDGDAPVQDWIGLLPDWQLEHARVADGIVTGLAPNLHKAVKWHGVWYGQTGAGWFLAMNTFKAHLKLTFFDGQHLTPALPNPLKTPPQSALNLTPGMALDPVIFADWVRQALQLPGWGKA